MLKSLDQKAAKTQVSGISEVENYLKTNGARLLSVAAKRGEIRQSHGAR
jgi:hypothetical protein